MSGVFNDITGFEVAFSVEQGDGQPEGGKLLASRARLEHLKLQKLQRADFLINYGVDGIVNLY